MKVALNVMPLVNLITDDTKQNGRTIVHVTGCKLFTCRALGSILVYLNVRYVADRADLLSFFYLPLLIIIQPVLQTYLSHSPEVCNSPDQAVYQHILCL
jgi:hypothetical protein